MAGGPEQELLTAVHRFAEAEIAPAAAGWSMQQSPDTALFARAAGLGLTGLEIPTALGGQGFGFAVKAAVCETLAAADFGFAMSVINTHNVGARLAASASETLRARYLPQILSGQISACTALTEPGAGSDFAAIQTRARQFRGGWVLDGEKCWIVNARRAELAIVFAQCGDAGDATSIGAYLVDLTASGVRRHAIDSGFSQTSIGTGGFTLQGVELSEEHLLLPPGTAFKSILAEINGARTYVAAMCNGMLRAAIDGAACYGKTRLSFGKPLADHPAWRSALGQAETELAASQALAGMAIHCIETGQDAQLAAAKAKVLAVATCQRNLPEMLHAMGAEGLRPEHPFTRHLAAAQMAALTDGATNILRDRVARLSQRSADHSKE